MATLMPVASSEVSEGKVTLVNLLDRGKTQSSSQLQATRRKRHAAFRGTTLLLLLPVLTVVATTVACFRGGRLALSWKPGLGRRSLSEVEREEEEDDSTLSMLVSECLELQEELGYALPESPLPEKDVAISRIVASMEQLEEYLEPDRSPEEVATAHLFHPLHTSGTSAHILKELTSTASDIYKQDEAHTSFPDLLPAPPAQSSSSAKTITAASFHFESGSISDEQVGCSTAGRGDKRGRHDSGAAAQSKRQKSRSVKTKRGPKEPSRRWRGPERAPGKIRAESSWSDEVHASASTESSATQPAGASELSVSAASLSPSSPNDFFEFLKAPPESLPSSPESSPDKWAAPPPPVSQTSSSLLPPIVHPYYRLPGVEAGAKPRAVNEAFVFTPNNYSHPVHKTLEDMRNLMLLPLLNQDQLNELVAGAEQLANFLVTSHRRGLNLLPLVKAVDELAYRYLCFDAIVCALQLAGPELNPSSWWKRLTLMIPTDYAPRVIRMSSRGPHFLSLTNRLCSALALLKRRTRPAALETISLKRDLFCRETTTGTFRERCCSLNTSQELVTSQLSGGFSDVFPSVKLSFKCLGFLPGEEAEEVVGRQKQVPESGLLLVAEASSEAPPASLLLKPEASSGGVALVVFVEPLTYADSFPRSLSRHLL
ncbi:hypothetical protein Esti_006162 [Eimeria stiedai]